MTAGAKYFQHSTQYIPGLVPVICSTQSLNFSAPKNQPMVMVWKMMSTHVNNETEMCHEQSVNYLCPQRSQANQILGGADAWVKNNWFACGGSTIGPFSGKYFSLPFLPATSLSPSRTHERLFVYSAPQVPPAGLMCCFWYYREWRTASGVPPYAPRSQDPEKFD